MSAAKSPPKPGAVKPKPGTVKKVDPAKPVIVASNRAARREYEILDEFEAGIVLKGSEVKSLREAQVRLNECYAYVQGNEVWLFGLHIAPYGKATNAAFGHEPARQRKLLMHRHEINRLRARMERERLTLVPLSMYFLNGRAKVELALARGLKLHDKRQVLAKRDADRDAARAIAAARRR